MHSKIYKWHIKYVIVECCRVLSGLRLYNNKLQDFFPHHLFCVTAIPLEWSDLCMQNTKYGVYFAYVERPTKRHLYQWVILTELCTMNFHKNAKYELNLFA